MNNHFIPILDDPHGHSYAHRVAQYAPVSNLDESKDRDTCEGDDEESTSGSLLQNSFINDDVQQLKTTKLDCYEAPIEDSDQNDDRELNRDKDVIDNNTLDKEIYDYDNDNDDDGGGGGGEDDGKRRKSSYNSDDLNARNLAAAANTAINKGLRKTSTIVKLYNGKKKGVKRGSKSTVTTNGSDDRQKSEERSRHSFKSLGDHSNSSQSSDMLYGSSNWDGGNSYGTGMQKNYLLLIN